LLTGFQKGLVGFYHICLIVVPVYTVVSILRETRVLAVAARACAPFMVHFGLPGEAAFTLVVGNFVNLYAALATVPDLSLSHRQVTLISLMLLISHSQLMEVPVLAKVTRWSPAIFPLRLAIALGLGFALRGLIGAKVMRGSVGLMVGSQAAGESLGAAAKAYGLGLASLGWKMLLVIVVSFVVLELIRGTKALQIATSGFYRGARSVGLEKDSCLPVISGLIFGVVWGAAAIVETARERGLGPKQMLLVAVFLGICHGFIEDTLLFVVTVRANLFWITVPRLIVAGFVTWAAAIWLRRSQGARNRKGRVV
jgi:spore maturation protein SpmB